MKSRNLAKETKKPQKNNKKPIKKKGVVANSTDPSFIGQGVQTKPAEEGLTNEVEGKGVEVEDIQHEPEGDVNPKPIDLDEDEEHNLFEQQAFKVRKHEGIKYLEKVFKDDPKKVREREPKDTLDIQEAINKDADEQPEEEIMTDWDGHPIVPGQFNLSIVKPDYTCICFGKRREGKSFLVRNILFSLRTWFTRGLVFSHTKHNGYWQNHIPDRFIHAEYDPYVLDKFIEQQRILHKAWKAGQPVQPWAFILMDDIIEPRLKYDPTLTKLFTEGRHFNLFVIVTTQYAKALPPAVRSNTDLAITFRQAELMQKEAIAEEYMTRVDKKEAMRLINVYTKKFRNGSSQFLAMNTDDSMANSIDDMFKIGRAVDPGPFLVGNAKFWGDELKQVEDNKQRKIENIEDDLMLHAGSQKGYDLLEASRKPRIIKRYVNF